MSKTKDGRNKLRYILSPAYLLPISVVVCIFSYGWNRVNIGAIVLILINIPFFINNRNKMFTVRKSFGIVLLVFFSAIIATFFMRDFSINYVYEITLYIFSYIVGGLYYKANSLETIQGLDNLKKIFFVIAIYGIFEFILCKNIIANRLGFHIISPYQITAIQNHLIYRVRTVFMHPIVYGNVLVIAIALNYFSSNKRKWIYYLVFSLNIFLTKSRSTWIVFLIEILILIYIERKNNVSKKIITLIGGILVLLIVILFETDIGIFSLILNRFTELKGSDSLNQRAGVIPVLFNLFFNSSLFQMIFGHGAHASKIIMKNVTIAIKNFGTVDNEWLSVLYDFGIIGITCLLFTLAGNFRKLLKANTKVTKSIACCIVVTLLCLLFYDGFTWMVIYYLFFLLLGILSMSK